MEKIIYIENQSYSIIEVKQSDCFYNKSFKFKKKNVNKSKHQHHINFTKFYEIQF